ncbi:MAG TPA: inositol monophosphatase [Acidimicrobiales bacterium]|nr:inositol monophosphatase [Acidimicrobiales bacterium]
MAEGTLAVLNAAADAVAVSLQGLDDWGLTGVVGGQYRHDTVADAAVLAVLDEAGFGVFSEESGLHHPERSVLVVVDPVDGSTNASRGLPWWAVSLCALDEDGPAAAVVYGIPTGERFEAVRGQGARRNGEPIAPSNVGSVSKAVLACNGYPPSNFGWAQYRAFGSAALELCAVACGALDGFIDFSGLSLAPWDYMGGVLMCKEAGAWAQDAFGRDLEVRVPGHRRAVVAAGGEALLSELLAVRGLAAN